MQNEFVQSQYNRQMIMRDVKLSPPKGTSVWELFNALLPIQDTGVGLSVTDDFTKLDTVASTGQWLATKGTGGTIALGTKGGGWINIPTAASLNDYQALSTQQPVFALANYTPIVFECAVNVTEANTNTSSWWCGLTSVLTTGFISNAGIPPASYSGFVFYKTEGTLNLFVQSSNGSTQTPASAANVAVTTVVSGQTYLLGAFLDPNDGVTGIVRWFISTVVSNVRQFVATGTVNLTLASLANMYFGFGVKTASANAETLMLDWAKCIGARYYQ
jgi:hypothetical protein